MNRLLILFSLFVGLTTINAQIHEIGVFIGGSNYIGDIGPTDFVTPNKLALGLLYKWNKSPRHTWRFSYMQSKITSSDSNSEIPSRKKRGFTFENNLSEASAGLEFNFFDFNLHNLKPKFTPYIYSGLSYVYYDGLYFNEKNVLEVHGKNRTFAIPITIGIKARIMQHLIIGFESGARYTFKDDLDGSNNLNHEDFKFGNINSNDWYVFTGFTLTYTFGIKPCYCKD